MSLKTNNKIKEIVAFIYRDTPNVKHEMCDYTGNKWSHRSNNKSLNENL